MVVSNLWLKLGKLVEMLKDAGLCHQEVLKPTDLLVHPHNRGATPMMRMLVVLTC